MSERTYTEREVVLRERKAFVDGRYNGARGWGTGECEREAARLYPLKVVRPRVVRDPRETDFEWTVCGGVLQYRLNMLNDVRQWENVHGSTWKITADRARLWADLLANPDETVDE